MLNTKYMVKEISILKLKTLLEQLKDDDKVIINAVGNIMIVDKNENYIGFIDFNNETISII